MVRYAFVTLDTALNSVLWHKTERPHHLFNQIITLFSFRLKEKPTIFRFWVNPENSRSVSSAY